jgi:hypothetical protein
VRRVRGEAEDELSGRSGHYPGTCRTMEDGRSFDRLPAGADHPAADFDLRRPGAERGGENQGQQNRVQFTRPRYYPLDGRLSKAAGGITAGASRSVGLWCLAFVMHPPPAFW